MAYKFTLKNVFMYNYVLTVSDEQHSYEAIVEYAPTKEKTILIWLDDFDFPEDEIDAVKSEVTAWFAGQNTKCIFYPGKGR